jgi:hypothetical protein
MESGNMSVNSKMTALADEIRELSGTTTTKSIDAMITDVDEANTEVNTQADLISQINTALEDALYPSLKLQSKTVTPSSIQQTIIADDNYDGLSKVIVSAMEVNTVYIGNTEPASDVGINGDIYIVRSE